MTNVTELEQLAERVEQLSAAIEAMKEERDAAKEERDAYHDLYLETLETCRRLERGLAGQKSEKLPADESQLTLA